MNWRETTTIQGKRILNTSLSFQRPDVLVKKRDRLEFSVSRPFNSNDSSKLIVPSCGMSQSVREFLRARREGQFNVIRLLKKDKIRSERRVQWNRIIEREREYSIHSPNSHHRLISFSTISFRARKIIFLFNTQRHRDRSKLLDLTA